MRRGGMFLSCAAIAALAGVMVVSDARDAHACGGCYHPPPTPAQIETSVVSDHRMVFTIGAQQTILWDQLRYTGNPSEFAWVLPVRPGTTIELSRDEWIAALDAVTQPRIVQPQRQSFGGGGFGGDDSNGGCACGSSMVASAYSDEGAPAAADAGPPPVQVVSEEVVGPYEAVIVRSDQPKALETWLNDHGFEVPAALEPTIAAYTEAKMDFAALRLRPGQGVQAMQPVRIVSPGADPTLPLRMVQAGVGAHVGLTLYVLSEGRYRPSNFPEAEIDDTKLVWDEGASRSNYQELSAAVMAQADGRTWLTEYADKPNTTTGGLGPNTNTSLYNAYYNACTGKFVSPSSDGGADAATEDAGEDAGEEAGTADAGDEDAGEDASTMTADAGIPSAPSATVPPPLCTSETDACCQFDDLELALSGLHRSDVWLTRLRADLPAAALNADLVIEAHPSQVAVSNVHNARFPDGTTAQIARVRRGTLGTGLAILGAGLLVVRSVRRRRRLHTER